MIDAGPEQHIFTEVQLDVRDDAIGQDILRLLDEKLCGAPPPERLLRDPDDMSKAARHAVAGLEREMGVTILTGSRA